MVSDERTGTCSTCDGLQNRSFHFRVAGFVQYGTHGLNNRGTFQECFFYAVIHYKVNVTLAIAEFGVFKGVISYTIFVFYNRQRFDGFCQYSQLLGMDTDFAHLGTEYKTLDSDEIA